MDLFTIWITVLVAIGLCVTGRIPLAKAAIAAAIVWLVGGLPLIIPALHGRELHQSIQIRQPPLVFFFHQRAREQKVGGCAVAGDRHVVDDRDAQQRLDVDIVRVGRQRIPEENDEVDPAFGDAGADLLIAAERPAAEPVTVRPSSAAIMPPVVPVANSSCRPSVPRL